MPVATGRAPYGWEWKDKGKTCYLINKEEAAVRVSIFEMFVELDMSIRGIAHKLTEDSILPPAKSRGANVKRGIAWQPSTVFDMLTDPSNIGILRICKSKTVMNANGKITRKPNDKMKTIPGGIPAIIAIDTYERAQLKLKNNQVNKSHPPENPEDFLLKGHIICKTCNYRMCGRNQETKGIAYPYYRCCKYRNKYDACPDLTTIRTNKVNALVWEDCCRVFERLGVICDTIEQNIEQSLQNILEDTEGRELIIELEEEITYAKHEREKHKEGSYYYKLISQDIMTKEEQLQRYEEEYVQSQDIARLSGVYQKSIVSFLDFLNTMKGRYHEATFQEKRNALDVLGVKVYIHPNNDDAPSLPLVETDREWLSIPEASDLTGITQSSLDRHIRKGNLTTHKRNIPMTIVHRDELARYLQAKRPHVSLDQYEDEWFSINRIITLKLANYRPLHRAIQLGEIKAETKVVLHRYIHRNELNRFLRESPVKPKSTLEETQARIEVTYTPIFTGVQQTFG